MYLFMEFHTFSQQFQAQQSYHLCVKRSTMVNLFCVDQSTRFDKSIRKLLSANLFLKLLTLFEVENMGKKCAPNHGYYVLKFQTFL